MSRATVPKARIKENDCFFFFNRQIWFAKVFFRILAITQTLCPQDFSESDFEFSFFAPNSPHYLASFLFRKRVHNYDLRRMAGIFILSYFLSFKKGSSSQLEGNSASNSISKSFKIVLPSDFLYLDDKQI